MNDKKNKEPIKIEHVKIEHVWTTENMVRQFIMVIIMFIMLIVIGKYILPWVERI